MSVQMISVMNNGSGFKALYTTKTPRFKETIDLLQSADGGNYSVSLPLDIGCTI